MFYIEKLAYNWTTTIELIILKRTMWTGVDYEKKISRYIWCNINVICYRRHFNCSINVKYMYMLINFFQIPWDLVPNERSTCFTGEIIPLFFNLFVAIQFILYQIYILYFTKSRYIYIYKYDVLYVIGLVHPCLVIICALGQVTCTCIR